MDIEWGASLRDELRRLELSSRDLSGKLSFNPGFTQTRSYNYKCYKRIFDGINEVVEYIRRTSINTYIFNPSNLSSDEYGTSSFNDFPNFQVAFNSLEYGTDLYFNKFVRELKKVDDFIKKYSIYKNTDFKNDIVGFVPIVPNFIKGNPINMINQERKEKPNPTATIIFEKAMPARYDSDKMISFASIIFSLIQILEKKGIRCEVYISSVFANEDEVFAYKIKLKNFMQPLNVYKLQFPIISTDMFRRIGFRLLESCKELSHRDWKDTYGETLIGRGKGFDLNGNGEPQPKLQELLDIKTDDIFIPNFAYFDYDTDDDIDYTIEKIIKRTNLQKYIKIKEGGI